MKRIFGTFVFLVLVAVQHIAQAQPLADIKFEKLDHNFGKIKEEGGPATFNFNFTNTGNFPLILQGVTSSCGCTTPEWSREPILPGKTGFIKVSYDPVMRPGIFNKSITINANIPQNSRVLTISGDVTPKILGLTDLYPVDFGGIRLKSFDLSFVRVKDNEIKTDTLQFYNPGLSPVKVKFKIIPAHITIKTVPSVIPAKTKGYFLITFDGNKKPSFGTVFNRIYLSFNNEEKFNHAIAVSATIEEDFSKLSAADLAAAPRIEYNSKTFDFGEIPEGKKVDYTFKISNKGKKPLIIRSVSASCACTTGQPASNTIQPGSSTGMKVTFDSKGTVGMQNKILTIISNDPENSTTAIRVTGSVNR